MGISSRLAYVAKDLRDLKNRFTGEIFSDLKVEVEKKYFWKVQGMNRPTTEEMSQYAVQKESPPQHLIVLINKPFKDTEGNLKELWLPMNDCGRMDDNEVLASMLKLSPLYFARVRKSARARVLSNVRRIGYSIFGEEVAKQHLLSIGWMKAPAEKKTDAVQKERKRKKRKNDVEEENPSKKKREEKIVEEKDKEDDEDKEDEDKEDEDKEDDDEDNEDKEDEDVRPKFKPVVNSLLDTVVDEDFPDDAEFSTRGDDFWSCVQPIRQNRKFETYSFVHPHFIRMNISNVETPFRCLETIPFTKKPVHLSMHIGLRIYMQLLYDIMVGAHYLSRLESFSLLVPVGYNNDNKR
jgi:hypothetical protein